MLHDVFRIQVFRQNNTEQNSILSKVHSSKKLHILKRVKATRNPVREAQRLDAIDYFNLLPDIKRIITYLWWSLCGEKKINTGFLYDTSLVGKKNLRAENCTAIKWFCYLRLCNGSILLSSLFEIVVALVE